MSLDKSLRSSEKLARKRNVLTREERLDKLAADDRWEDGDSVFGLPKVKVVVKAAPKKKLKEKEPEEAELAAEGEPVEGTEQEEG